MKIALLGYGKEGQASEKYFKEHFDAECKIFTDFDPFEIAKEDFSDYDLVLRSPSVHPFSAASSMTAYFFEHCPCKIIGVTGTKGKGTTCSLIKSILEALGHKTYLVGNIGIPSISILDELDKDCVVVYEMSSFQLWDMKKSPDVSVVVTIEPDHLNVHCSYEDYTSAKMNIGRWQDPDDYMVYYAKNSESKRIAEASSAQKIPYSLDTIESDILEALYIPGFHNRENAAAAITAVACYLKMDVIDFINTYRDKIKVGLSTFHGLPHRLEFIRSLNGVRYYDDNFSTNPSSTRVAVEAFPNNSIVMIVGGRDKTNNEDFPEIYKIISAANVKKVVLMGESGHAIFEQFSDERFLLAESLDEAIAFARNEAEKLADAVVLMSPSAASFDMFKDVYDRGAQFHEKIVALE